MFLISSQRTNNNFSLFEAFCFSEPFPSKVCLKAYPFPPLKSTNLEEAQGDIVFLLFYFFKPFILFTNRC